jgi:hypothetical protein
VDRKKKRRFSADKIRRTRGKTGEAKWSRRRDLNLQPPVYKTGALPLSYTGMDALT